MKNLIIVGASRSGKSTVAKRMAEKYSMTYIPFDAIVSTLENLYPEVGIKHIDDNVEMSKKIAVFLKEYMKHLEYENINYILDLYQLFPNDLSEICDLEKQLIVYFGYPNISANEKLLYVKEFAREKDWTKNVSDSEMIKILELFIHENNLMYQQCMKHQYKFFDTGSNFIEVLKKIELYLSENIL